MNPRAAFACGTRDRALVNFASRILPGPNLPVAQGRRASDDRARYGPALAVAADGGTHVVRLSHGRVRSGVFHAHAHDSGIDRTSAARVAHTAGYAEVPRMLERTGQAFLSWQTQAGGYRLIEMEEP